MAEHTHHTNTEQAILEAAEREFLAKGFEGARTTSIARAAGVTHAMLHYYFRTKEKIFERILDEKMRLIGESVLTAFGQPGLPLPERLRQGIENHFDLLAAQADLPRFVVTEVFSHPERCEVMRRRIRRILDRLLVDLQRELDEAAARGEADPVDALTLLLDIISLNVFSILAYPLLAPLVGDPEGGRDRFFAMRKAENVAAIRKRILKIPER